MKKIFISYHHKNEQYLKEDILDLNFLNDIFIDCSVDTGDIDENLEPQQIRQTIRRNYLCGSTVLLLLVGKETMYRKHVDWELYSSMYNGTKFGRSGIVVVHASNCNSNYCSAPFDEIKKALRPNETNWIRIEEKSEYERRFPYLPPRIIDSKLKPNNNITVLNWDEVSNDPDKLRLIIECAHNARISSEYDLSRPMRMKDHNPYT